MENPVHDREGNEGIESDFIPKEELKMPRWRKNNRAQRIRNILESGHAVFGDHPLTSGIIRRLEKDGMKIERRRIYKDDQDSRRFVMEYRKRTWLEEITIKPKKENK
jgi:hypothetical protein